MMHRTGRLAAGRTLAALLLVVLLTSCGYRLVGQGGDTGVIPAEVTTLSVQGSNAVARGLAPGLRQQLARSERYRVVYGKEAVDDAAHALLRIDRASESFVPSSYDASGIATQYRMQLSAAVRIYRTGKLFWESGAISVAGDVFVAGGPASIESSRERIRQDLQKEWVQKVMARIRSGF